MDSTIVFSVGGLAFALQGKVPVQVQDSYLPFVEASAESDVEMRMHLGPAPDWTTSGPHALLYDTGDAWSLHRSRDLYVLNVPSASCDGTAHCQALISDDLTSVDLYVGRKLLTGSVAGRPALRLEALMYPLAELLLIWLLARRGGILVHGVGIVDGAQGYLFAGNSGHGKTTMARLWPEGTTILNDDRIVVRPREGRFWMYGTPWHGDFQQVSPDTFPISKLFFLLQSASNYAQPSSVSDSATLLLTRSFLPLWDRAAMSTLLSSCAEVALAVPCYDLGFRPGPEIVEYVRDLL